MIALRPLLLFCALSMPLNARATDIEIGINNISLHVELAATPQSRARGLMQRTELCGDCGMLLVFEDAGKHDIWMKDTPLPLSVAFIAEDGRILNIEELHPNSLQRFGARGAALYALEMKKGWFARHAVKPGDRVQKLSGLHAFR